MVIFTARQNLTNLNEVKMNLIVKFANLAGKSYIKKHIGSLGYIFTLTSEGAVSSTYRWAARDLFSLRCSTLLLRTVLIMGVIRSLS